MLLTVGDVALQGTSPMCSYQRPILFHAKGSRYIGDTSGCDVSQMSEYVTRLNYVSLSGVSSLLSCDIVDRIWIKSNMDTIF